MCIFDRRRICDEEGEEEEEAGIGGRQALAAPVRKTRRGGVGKTKASPRRGGRPPQEAPDLLASSPGRPPPEEGLLDKLGAGEGSVAGDRCWPPSMRTNLDEAAPT